MPDLGIFGLEFENKTTSPKYPQLLQAYFPKSSK